MLALMNGVTDAQVVAVKQALAMTARPSPKLPHARYILNKVFNGNFIRRQIGLDRRASAWPWPRPKPGAISAVGGTCGASHRLRRGLCDFRAGSRDFTPGPVEQIAWALCECTGRMRSGSGWPGSVADRSGDDLEPFWAGPWSRYAGPGLADDASPFRSVLVATPLPGELDRTARLTNLNRSNRIAGVSDDHCLAERAAS